MAPPGCFVSSFRGHQPSHQPSRRTTAPPELVGDLFEEVLLRTPPTDPATLVYAALACKRWHRLIGSPRFRRRYGDFHRGALLLGFVVNLMNGDEYIARYIPAPPRSASLRVVDMPGWRAVHACHGRVLLSKVAQGPNLTIWDPVTDERRHVDSMPPLDDFGRSGGWSAAVVCAGHGGTCDHLDCRGGDSLVVLLGVDLGEMSLCTYLYSSQTAQWSSQHVNWLPRKGVVADTPALVGNLLYFGVDLTTRILGFDLGTKKTVDLDPPAVPSGLFSTLFATKDERLGFAHVVGSTITVWSLVGDTATWARDMVLDSLPVFTEISAFTQVSGISLVGTVDGLQRLESDGATEICHSTGIYNIVPYVSIYTPEKVSESREPDLDAYNANIV